MSEVLWSMVFHIALKMTGFVGGIAIFVLFSAWAGMLFEEIHGIVPVSVLTRYLHDIFE